MFGNAPVTTSNGEYTRVAGLEIDRQAVTRILQLAGGDPGGAGGAGSNASVVWLTDSVAPGAPGDLAAGAGPFRRGVEQAHLVADLHQQGEHPARVEAEELPGELLRALPVRRRVHRWCRQSYASLT